MKPVFGAVFVTICVFGGYWAMGGAIHILWQPFEVVIICGAAIGAYVISNSPTILKQTLPDVRAIGRPARYGKEAYLEMLTLLFIVFKTAKSKGFLALESHIENPDESEIFQQFPKVAQDPDSMRFICDYLRLISMGSDSEHSMEDLMDEELEAMHHERMKIAEAVHTMADGLPALGIVAAVLGVIKTMAHIDEPPEVLGQLIGGALVGTFLGVILSYGFVGPLSHAMRGRVETEMKYFHTIKVAMVSYLQGNAPQIAVEHARKSMFNDVRPTFVEVEDATSNAPVPAAA